MVLLLQVLKELDLAVERRAFEVKEGTLQPIDRMSGSDSEHSRSVTIITKKGGKA